MCRCSCNDPIVRVCGNCKEQYTINPEFGYWHNYFYCSAACCAVRRQQIEEDKERTRTEGLYSWEE